MLRRLIILLLIVGISLAQNTTSDTTLVMQYKDKKFNLSVGLADNRTGMNFIGLSYKIFQKDNNETYIGIGTALFVINVSLGWKHYWLERRKSPYTALSIQALTKLLDSNGYWPYKGVSIAPTISVGMEKEISKTLSSQYGLSIMAMESETSRKMIAHPYWIIALIFRL